MTEPRFFKSPDTFRKWLEKNHDRAAELLVGFYSRASGKSGLTYAEALDEALCYGWIDGVRKNRDASSYTIRFSPRKAKSYWSNVNIRHAKRLIEEGRMAPPGLAAFEARDEDTTRRYSFERETASLDAAQERTFRANARAWTYFESQPPGYRRVALWYVVSAKREETRQKRLGELIAVSERGERLPQVGSARPAQQPQRGAQPPRRRRDGN